MAGSANSNAMLAAPKTPGRSLFCMAL